MNSQNGWPLVAADQLDKSPVPGTAVVPVPGLLRGDVAKLLLWVGEQFNQKVAPLYNPGCWGWNSPTPIPGSNIYSNHCSGTAIDFNAPSFPWQTRTMTPSQRQACREIVSRTEGVVAWGGDFTTVTDEMHFEINGTKEQVARIVKKIEGEDMPYTDEQYSKLKADRDKYAEDWARLRYIAAGVDPAKVSQKDRQLRLKLPWEQASADLTRDLPLGQSPFELNKQIEALKTGKVTSLKPGVYEVK